MRDTTTRRAAAGLLALVTAAACTPSRVDPDATVNIRGDVRRGGAPLVGARVALTRDADAVEALALVTSLGLICLPREDPPAICRGARVTRTGSDGRFRFQMKGRDTHDSFGSARRMAVSAAAPPAGIQAEGPATSIRFEVQTTTLDVPLTLWEPRIAGLAGPRNARLRWSALPREAVPPAVPPARMQASVRFDRGSSERVWTIAPARNPLVFDPRLLEDSTGTVSVAASARGIVVDERRGHRIDAVVRSPRLAYEGPADPPASRGRPCFAYDARRRPVSQAACRLTDGEFATRFEALTRPPCIEAPESCPPEPRHTAAFVDLESVRPVKLVVVRGCDDCTIETSRDARSWRLAGAAAGRRDVALTPRDGERARYVRVSQAAGADTLREVSVWDGTERIREGSFLTRPFRDDSQAEVTQPGGATRSGDAGDRGNRAGTVLTVAAVVLLVAAAAALALVVGRRRGRIAPTR